MADGAAGDRLTQAVAIEKKARQFEHEGRLAEAFAEYKNAANVFQYVYRWEQNPRVKEMVRERLEEVIKRAEAVKQNIESPAPPPAPAAAPGGAAAAVRPPQQGQPPPAPGQAPGAQDGKEDEDPEAAKLKKGLEGAILTSKPNVKWDDVAGLVQAKGMLQETVILPVRFPQLFQGKRQPWKGILLYGPPGTGKSYLAMACATEADSTFFSISSSDLVSKWQGESEKLVRSLFEMARDQKPAIIFIDEVDSLCGARGEGEAESSRRIKTEFLVQMEGVGKAQGDLLVLGATNCPWDLDAAIRRRFERRIYIPLPEVEARQLCLKINLGSTVHSLVDQDFARIAELTEGLSAADMKILVRDAIFEPVRRLQRAVCFKQTARPEDGKLMWTPCSPGADGAVEKTLMQINPDELQEPLVCMADFEGSATRVKPSVAEGDLKQYQDWTEQYGMEG